LDDTTAFLRRELADFSTMTGTSNMAEHQIKMKDDKPIKQSVYPKNQKIQGKINAKVNELLQMGFMKKMTGKWRLFVDFRHINAK